MRLIKQLTLASSAVSRLMEQVDNSPLTVKELSQDLNASEEFLMQIMRTLKKSSLVISIRGPGGGYKVSESARKLGVSIMDIITAMEGSVNTESTGTRFFSDEKAAEVNAVVTDALSKVMVTSLPTVIGHQENQNVMWN